MPGAATIYVKQLEPMASFYAACFGLEVVADSPGDSRILESADWTLSVVQVPENIAAIILVADPPVRRTGTPIKLSFDVASITVTRETINDHGGRVDEQAWEYRGHRHCDFVDPEGNVNQLREPVSRA